MAEPGRHLEASTSSVTSLRALLGAFGRAGGKRAELLRRLNIDEALVRREEARIAFDVLLQAWELAPELLGDDSFGLHYGASLPRGAHGLVEYLARASRTLGDALQHMVRYQRLLHDRVRYSISTHDELVSLGARVSGPPGGAPRHFNEALITALLSRARDLTGVEDVAVEVAFTHLAPADVREHRRILRVPVRFEAPQNLLVLRREAVALPLREADDALATVLDALAARELQRLPRLSDGPRLCRELIAAQLSVGEAPRLGDVARELAVSTRVLQRALASAGWTFRGMVDDVRRELALAWVKDTQETASAIADRLGFADASSFHHAFRRWTGKCVGDYVSAAARPRQREAQR